MKYLTSLLVFLLLLALTACGGGATEEAAGTPEPAPTEVPATPPPPPTATQAPAPDANAGDSTTPLAQNSAPGCRAESITTLINLAKVPGIPPLSETDWQHGGAEARVTVMEYGDFQ